MDTGRHAGRGFRGGDPHDLRADFPATAEGNLVRLLPLAPVPGRTTLRSEEHTSELQSLMRISYAVFCLKKKKTDKYTSAITIIDVNHTCNNQHIYSKRLRN